MKAKKCIVINFCILYFSFLGRKTDWAANAGPQFSKTENVENVGRTYHCFVLFYCIIIIILLDNILIILPILLIIISGYYWLLIEWYI